MSHNILQKLDGNMYLLNCLDDCRLSKLLRRGAAGPFSLAVFTRPKHYILTTKLADVPEKLADCTFNCFDPNGKHLLGRTMHTGDHASIAVKMFPKEGYHSIALATENHVLFPFRVPFRRIAKNIDALSAAPFVCTDGINEKGLAISAVPVKGSVIRQKNGHPPITAGVAVRVALERCANVDEALRMFGSFDMRGKLGRACHFHIADPSGRSAVVEYRKNKMYVVYPSRRVQYTHNSFAVSSDQKNEKLFQYDPREGIIKETLSAARGVMREEFAWALLQRCRNVSDDGSTPSDRVRTLLFNCDDCSVTVSTEANLRTVYTLKA